MLQAGQGLPCLHLFSPEERQDYKALTRALQRYFGQCLQPDKLRSQLCNRRRHRVSHLAGWLRTLNALLDFMPL